MGEIRSVKSIDAWTHKYIFPNGMLPSVAQLGKAIEGLFVMEDWHNIGSDYDKTLMSWYDNFKNSWNKIKDKYDERFYKMWEYFYSPPPVHLEQDTINFGRSFYQKTEFWEVIVP